MIIFDASHLIFKNIQESKSFDKEREPKVISNKKIENKKESIDKALVLLQRKKLNDLKILARDLKIKEYSTMKKEDLIKALAIA